MCTIIQYQHHRTVSRVVQSHRDTHCLSPRAKEAYLGARCAKAGLSCSQLCPQHLKQCLTHRTCSERLSHVELTQHSHTDPRRLAPWLPKQGLGMSLYFSHININNDFFFQNLFCLLMFHQPCSGPCIQQMLNK